MGMDQTVTFAAAVPPWPAVRDLLARGGFPVELRMVDGELAFPDEEPPETWRELRLGTPHGMVTLRRDADRISFVVWGNAERALLQARNALMAAFAETGGGEVQTEAGYLTSAQFRAAADLP